MSEKEQDRDVPLDGEVWQDSEGCLLNILNGQFVFAFGRTDPIEISHLPLGDRPAKRVFDTAGSYVGGGQLDYPNGTVFR